MNTYIRIFTVDFLLYLAPAGGFNPAGQSLTVSWVYPVIFVTWVNLWIILQDYCGLKVVEMSNGKLRIFQDNTSFILYFLVRCG